MVKYAVLGSLCLALGACDPFAPTPPEQPLPQQPVQRATSPADVPGIWSMALTSGNLRQVDALFDDNILLTHGTFRMSREQLYQCHQAIVTKIVDTAWAEWNTLPSGNPDSLSGSVRWGIQIADMPLVQSVARWYVARDAQSEWHLTLWEDATNGSSFDNFCQEVTQ